MCLGEGDIGEILVLRMSVYDGRYFILEFFFIVIGVFYRFFFDKRRLKFS